MTGKGRTKSDEKRQQILETASDLFLTKGFHETSMDDIADIAGVSKQTVYSHFNRKEDLFVTVIQRRCASHNLSPSLFTSQRPCRDVLMEMSQHFVELVMNEGAVKLLRTCVGGAEIHPDVAQMFYRAAPQEVTAMLADYLARQTALGVLQVDNPQNAARQLLFMLKGDAHLRTLLNLPVTQTQDELNEYLASCVEVFIKAYGAPS